MNAFYVILAACPVLLLALVAFFVMVVVGIRKGDRSGLTSVPRNRLDAITRRVAGVGVRRDNTDNE
jgi:hypothetical protein